MTNVAYKTFNNLQKIQQADTVGRPQLLVRDAVQETCLMRPSGNTYKFDHDPTQFRYILNYLRNGGHLDKVTLPKEKKELLEILMEGRYFCVS